MERRIQLAEEMSSTKRDLEADELRRELEEARMAERMAKIQLEETRGPLSPPLPPLATTTGIAVRNSSVSTGVFGEHYFLHAWVMGHTGLSLQLISL